MAGPGPGPGPGPDADPGPDPDLERVRARWTALGRDDPMWAVLTDRGRRRGRWSADELFATGRAEVGGLFDLLGAWGVVPGTGRALDFGCGVGRLTRALAERFDEVVGIDVSPTMIERARELDPGGGRITWLAGGSDRVAGVDSASVDLVYSCRVLQHVPPRLVEGYLAEFGRVLRPGGIVAVQIPERPSAHPKGLVVRVLPTPVADRLRRGMEMHGIPRGRVAEVLEGAGVEVLGAQPDRSAGPAWVSWLHVGRRRRVG